MKAYCWPCGQHILIAEIFHLFFLETYQLNSAPHISFKGIIRILYLIIWHLLIALSALESVIFSNFEGFVFLGLPVEACGSIPFMDSFLPVLQIPDVTLIYICR